MPNIFDYYSHADLGIDPDECDLNHGHCPGPAYPGAPGCGKFLARGAYLCKACAADSNEYYAADLAYSAEQSARQQDELAQIDAWQAQDVLYAELPF